MMVIVQTVKKNPSVSAFKFKMLTSLNLPELFKFFFQESTFSMIMLAIILFVYLQMIQFKIEW